MQQGECTRSAHNQLGGESCLVMQRPTTMTADALNRISVKKGWQLLSSTSVPTRCPSLPLPGIPYHPAGLVLTCWPLGSQRRQSRLPCQPPRLSPGRAA